MELTTFISEIEKHLKKPTGLIAVSQGPLKLTKANTRLNKYNFNLQDVLAIGTTVEGFVKQLPDHGFTDGAVMYFRLQRGATTHLVGETVLKFATNAAQLAAPINESQTVEPSVMPQQAAPIEILKPVQPTPPPQMPMPTMPQAAMGYTQVPSHEWISLKVKEERHADLLQRLNKAEKDRDQAESDLRMEKEKTFGLERKLDTIADRHELALERMEKDKKSFLETEAGKEVIGLAGRIPEMIQALKPQPQISSGGMGNPLAGASAAKQGFAQQLADYPDEIIPILQQVANHTMNTEGFFEALQNQLNTMNNG